MVISEFVEIKVSVSNMNYWRGLGYKFPNPAPRWNIIPKIQVKVSDLESGSNVRVDCKCDFCEVKYSNRFCRHTDICNKCFASEKMKGNTLGFSNKGRIGLSGEDHPRWNPNKKDFQKFANRVRWLTEKTYNKHKSIINPNNYNRTLCGVDNGWQLDHITSIKEAFDKNLSAEMVSDLKNLQMLPWSINRTKAA